MSGSPNRRQYGLRLTNTIGYTNINTIQKAKYNISQHSPLINSPRLNQQSYYQNQNIKMTTELKTKLQIVLKHNSQLLNENATLSQMVNGLRNDLEFCKKQEEINKKDVNKEMNKLIEQINHQQQNHQHQLTRLLNQIGQLHQDNLRFETQKNHQIRTIKDTHERELALHITQIKRSSDDNKDILDLHVKKLKQTIQLRNFQIQTLKAESKSENDRLRFQVQNLQNQMQHIRKLKQIQQKQLMNQNRQKIRSQQKQSQREKQLQVLKRQSMVKKLKKQLAQKSLQLQQSHLQGSTQTEQLYDQLSSAKHHTAQLVEELEELKEISIQKFNREKERLISMTEIQKENMQNVVTTERTLLKDQREKVILLCIQKTQEIKRLYQLINQTKSTFDVQKSTLLNLINEFKRRLKDIQLQNQEQTELLKIKMAQLHEGDIRALESYYENQTRNLLKQNKIISQAHEADRVKLHKALQDNDEIRKNFEVEISKQKAKLQDMKVKFAAANVEFKEQITSLGTKMQLTSQTLVRQTQQKQKGAQFFETEKRKFYRLIQQKDRQIMATQQTMSALKQINDQEISQLHSQINMLRDSLISKQQEFKQYKMGLQTQFQRKSLRIIQQSKKIAPDEQIISENTQLRQKCVELEKQNFKKSKQLQFLLRQKRSLQGQLGLKDGFLETIHLQSSAAIEDETSKVKILMNQSEIAMKDYYENKINSKDKDVEHLKKQLAQKDYDLRAIITKYNALQKKLKQLLEAHSKLSQFETKITNLGLDQNLVKNMAELFKRHKNE